MDNLDSNKEVRKENFLKEYKELVMKYKTYIGSCGCCDSPWVTGSDDNNKLSSHIDHLEDR